MNARADSTSDVTAATVAARRGIPLGAVIGATDTEGWQPVELSVSQRHDLLDVWTTMFTDVYVHYTQKRALYGFDPLRALMALRRQIPYLDSGAFLRELTLLINRLRDAHTQLYVNAADPALTPYVAVLPFLVEVFGEYRSPSYLVTKVSDDVAELDGGAFGPGARLTTWNGVPFARHVDLYADTLTGGRPDAHRARALETLTQRPLEYLPPPDELWVDLGFRRPDDDADLPDRTIRFEWRAVAPSKALTAPTAIEVRTRRAVDATTEMTRRARKLLFSSALWAQDHRPGPPVARGATWLETSFPDAVSARRLRTPHGTFGYLRLWTFDVEHSGRFADEIARILRQLPRKGLIIDLRSNPGGVIDTAERLLQLFTAETIQPVRFALRATPTMVALAEADGNGADFADWAGTVRTALELGEEFSQHLPISDPERCNGLPRAYRGPVVAVVSATTFSCGDIFAAGLADHGIGQVVAVGEATGAGGANVWTDADIAYAYHAAGLRLPSLPPGIGFSVSVRRIVRSGLSAGIAVEDIGVRGDDRYDMTERDLLEGNCDLIEFCAGLLAAR